MAFLILVRNQSRMHRISTLKVEATPETTIGALKRQVEDETGLPVDEFDLRLGSTVLEDARTVAHYSIVAGARPRHILDMPSILLCIHPEEAAPAANKPGVSIQVLADSMADPATQMGTELVRVKSVEEILTEDLERVASENDEEKKAFAVTSCDFKTFLDGVGKEFLQSSRRARENVL